METSTSSTDSAERLLHADLQSPELLVRARAFDKLYRGLFRVFEQQAYELGAKHTSHDKVDVAYLAMSAATMRLLKGPISFGELWQFLGTTVSHEVVNLFRRKSVASVAANDQ